MGHVLRHSIAQRAAALCVAALLTAGCTAWHHIPGNPDALVARGPAKVRVWQDRGAPVVLYAPQVEGSELVGYLRNGDAASRTGIPMSEVRFVDERRVDAARTGLVVGPIVTAGAVFAIIKLVEAIGKIDFRPRRTTWHWHV